MVWVLSAWGAAVVIAAVVLGFCAYELVWKLRRAQRDAAALQQVADGLARLAAELSASAAAARGSRVPDGPA